MRLNCPSFQSGSLRLFVVLPPSLALIGLSGDAKYSGKIKADLNVFFRPRL
jgi:hypothetical protein